MGRLGLRRDIQYRVPAPNGTILGFEMDRDQYLFTGVSSQRDLIPNNVPVFWRAYQYSAKCSNGFNYEVYVYYYGAFEGGQWAVIDAMRQYN